MVRPVLGALAVMLALASCGGDPKADPTPTPSSPATTPVSTTPAPPVMPEAAKANTKAGAVAFVRYYIAAFNHAQKTGATEDLVAASTSACDDCQAAISGLDEIYAAGGHIEGGELVPGSASVEHNAIERYWLVLVRVESGPQSVATISTAEPKEFPGGSRSMQFSLTRSGGTWKVTSWKRA
jgi:hypothetical protein